MSGNRIASRYAKSLLDLCIEKGLLDTVLADMHVLASALDGSRDLQLLLSSPIVKADKKISIIHEIFDKHVSELTISFITLLAKKGREGVLRGIVHSFIQQVRDHKGIVLAEVVSAIALDSGSLQKVTELATTLAGKQVELEQKVDSELIGGFILKVGDKQVDHSVSGKIKNLRREFAENPYIPEL